PRPRRPPWLDARPAACYAVRAALAVGDLHRRVSVGLRRLDLRHAIVGDVEHRHRDGVAVVGEDPRHAYLATHQSQTHVCPFVPRRLRLTGELIWLLQFDLDVDTRRQIELHQLVDRLVGWIDD